MIHQYRKRMIWGLLIGVAVFAAIVIFNDFDALSQALRRFDWRLLPLVLGLTVVNYVVRFVKWEYLLDKLDVRGLTRRDSLLIFLAAFTMVMTPGKIGEVLKAYLVKLRTGVPIARTASAVFIERASDGIALLVLSAFGMTMFRFGWQLLVLGAVLSVAGLWLLQRERWINRAMGWLGRTRVGERRVGHLIELYNSTRMLLRPRPFTWSVVLGVVSWMGECLAFFVVLIGLGIPATWSLLVASVFVFSASTWIGAVSMLPGGLGAAELSVAGLLLLTVKDPAMTPAVASAATLLIRFATLWFGVLIGMVALSRVSNWPSTLGDEPDPDMAELSKT